MVFLRKLQFAITARSASKCLSVVIFLTEFELLVVAFVKMPKRRNLSDEERSRILFLHEQGKSQVEIAKTLKCSRCAVQSAIKRFKDTGSHVDKKRTGRKRLTSKREDRNLIRESLKNRKKTSFELAAGLSDQIGRTISARTTRRRLGEAGLKGCKARKKPWLSEKNKKARLEWALKHQCWTKNDWENVIWSDESNFEVSFILLHFNYL